MYQVPPDPQGNDPTIRAWLRDMVFISSTGIILMSGLFLGLVVYASRFYAGLAGVILVIGAGIFFVRSYVQRKQARQPLRAIWLAAFLTASGLIFFWVVVFSRLG